MTNKVWSKSIEQQSPDLCVDCGEDTSFGSGRFVNRIPSDDNWLCADCLYEIDNEMELEENVDE